MEMTPEEGKASMGIATRLLDQILASQKSEDEAFMGTEMSEGMPLEMAEASEESQSSSLKAELGAIKDEDKKIENIIKSTLKQELGTIKQELLSVLEEDEKEDENGEQKQN